MPVDPQPILLTFDVDWAPDFMVEAVAGALVERDVKATWLVTHSSPAIDRLRERPDLFELGIHPNFLPGSSHGATVAEVLATSMHLVPEARSMRSHALVQSSPILTAVLESTPIRCDSSLLLPDVVGIGPVRFPHAGGELVRIPYFWEDDVEMLRREPRWTLHDYGDGPGLRVFDFHPVHVFLNAADTESYRVLVAGGGLASIAEEEAVRHVRTGPGPATLFLEIADRLASGGSQTLWDVAGAFHPSEVA